MHQSNSADGHYRELVDNAPDAILVVSNGKLLFANQAAANLVGLPDPEAMLNHSVLEFVPPELRNEIVHLIQQLYQERRAASLFETEVARVDGTRRHVELMARPTIYEGSKGSIVFIRDITDRKLAESALHASEERYRQVVESMNEALIVYDPDARITFVNQQFCEIFGVKAEDVIGEPCSAVYAPDTVAIVDWGIVRRRQGLHDRYDARLNANNGRSIFAQLSAAPLVHDGEFAGSLALITDITDRQLTQERLRKSEQRYREIVDSSPNFIVSFDCDDRYTAANKAAYESLGLQEHEMLGRTLEEAGVPAEVAQEWRSQNASVRASGRTQTRETVVSFQKASARVLRRTVSPMYSEDGTLIGVGVLAIDISEQKAADERNHKLLRAIEEMDEVMFTTDAAGVITYVNPAFERIYGFTREEAVGKTPRIIKSHQTPGAVYEHFWRELSQGRTVRTEFLNQRKDGQLVRMVATVSPIHGDDGKLNGFTAVQRDVTAERNAERQLAHTAKMQALGTLAGGIAHDFNNILSIVLTHATVAELSKNNPTRTHEAMATIKRAVSRGASLSRQILTFARNTEVQFANVDMNRCVEEMGSMVHEMFPRNIQIELDLDPRIPAIRADADQLHQVLLNLSLNARDAMSEGGTLRMTTKRVGSDAIRKSFPAALPSDYACITVTDTGHGMTPDVVSRIFEPFFTTKEVGKGTGLGLAVVYGVMKAHRGWIQVSSEPGRGSTFNLYFPGIVAVVSGERPDASHDIEHGDEALLLIEDEKEIADAIAVQLADRGYDVVTANNADEAMEKLSTRTFDLIISDLGLPGIASREVVKLFRATAPDLPLIPMTGYVDSDLHNDIVAAGAEPILEKPFTIDQLLRRIREVLGSRSSVAS